MKLLLKKSGLTPLEKNSLTGLTILELLVATMVATLTFMVLFYVSFTIQDNININSGILSITETGRFAVDRISNDIREAEEVSTSYGSYNTGNTALILEIPVTDVNGAITGYDIVIYALEAGDPTKLRHIVYAAPGSSKSNVSEIITEDIKSLLFSSGGTGLSSVTDKSTVKIVTVKIEIARIIMGFERLNEVTTAVSLRNKKLGL